MSIEIKNLSFAYEDKQILNNLSLSIKTGESVGIVGVSGGGKSTLLKLVSGLYEIPVCAEGHNTSPLSTAYPGKITIMGESSSESRRKSIAMVMQSASLFPVSIRENITCGHDISPVVLHCACDAAQLTQWIATLPEGLDTFVGERGGKVSGGQAQRIAIARAIAKNAPVILLDEPTSALDNDTSDAVIKALESLTKGKTVLFVSHRRETLGGCNRIFRLEGGRLYAD